MIKVKTWNGSHGGRELMQNKGRDHVVVEEVSSINEKNDPVGQALRMCSTTVATATLTENWRTFPKQK